MNYDLSYQECNNRPLRIRAYYNESNYKQSQTFTVTRLQTAYGFNGTMPDLTIEPGQVKTITWNANFVPMYVTLGIKNIDGSIFPMATIIKATMDPSMSYDLEWEKAQTGTMYVRADHVRMNAGSFDGQLPLFPKRWNWSAKRMAWSKRSPAA